MKKRQQRKTNLDADWQQLKASWQAEPGFARSTDHKAASGGTLPVAVATRTAQPQSAVQRMADNARLASAANVHEQLAGACTAAPAQVYTGQKLVGIGVLHKSNLVPIFRTEDAADIAKMRR